MRITRIVVAVLAIVVMVVGVSLRLTSSGKSDKPVITCKVDDVIEASISVTDEELLSYVTAYDKQDGDLTSDIVVSRKNFFIEPNTSTVVFAVSDSDNNISNIEKKLYFNDYKPPEIILNNDFIFPSGYNFDLAYYVRAEDVIDGDISAYIKQISTEFVNTAGTYKVNMKVSNSMTDSTNITVNAIVTDNYSFDVRIRLSQYITYVYEGAELDYASFITNVTSKGKPQYDVGDVTIDSSAVDLSKAGVYDVFYRITSGTGEDAQEISLTRLVVVVREAE